MNTLEQDIVELKKISEGNTCDGTTWHDGTIYMAKKALSIVERLQKFDLDQQLVVLKMDKDLQSEGFLEALQEAIRPLRDKGNRSVLMVVDKNDQVGFVSLGIHKTGGDFTKEGMRKLLQNVLNKFDHD